MGRGVVGLNFFNKLSTNYLDPSLSVLQWKYCHPPEDSGWIIGVGLGSLGLSRGLDGL